MQTTFKILAVTAIFLVPQYVLAGVPNSPNVLIIMADDCTFNDLSLYGGVNAKTPHIERLASGGLVFNKAYLSHLVELSISSFFKYAKAHSGLQKHP